MRCKPGSLVIFAPDCSSMSRMTFGQNIWYLATIDVLQFTLNICDRNISIETIYHDYYLIPNISRFAFVARMHISTCYPDICQRGLRLSQDTIYAPSHTSCFLKILWAWMPPRLLRSRYTSGRTPLTPWGNIGYNFVKVGNVLSGRTVLWIIIALWKGCRILLEQPSGSFLPELPRYQWLWRYFQVC